MGTTELHTPLIPMLSQVRHQCGPTAPCVQAVEELLQQGEAGGGDALPPCCADDELQGLLGLLEQAGAAETAGAAGGAALPRLGCGAAVALQQCLARIAASAGGAGPCDGKRALPSCTSSRVCSTQKSAVPRCT